MNPGFKGHNFGLCRKCGKVHVPWQKGLTKDTDKRLKTMGDKVSKALKGKPSWKKGLTKETDRRINSAWNKGLTKETDDRLKAHSLKMMKVMKGRTFSPECLSKKRVVMKRYWDDPSFRTKMSAIHQTPEFKRKSLCEWTDEMKAKMSAARRGKKLSSETKAKLSSQKIGEQNPSWNGGTSFIPYAPSFNCVLKKQILERDGNKCQVCGSTHRLTVHHIDYDKLNSASSNLITLCGKHNVKVNFNREYWLLYFQNLQERRLGIVVCT
jgi:hypothetical protein